MMRTTILLIAILLLWVWESIIEFFGFARVTETTMGRYVGCAPFVLWPIDDEDDQEQNRVSKNTA